MRKKKKGAASRELGDGWVVLFYIWACATVRRFRVWVLGKWEGRRKGKEGRKGS